MDWCVYQTLKFFRGIRRAVLHYDIMCQYWTNFAKGFEQNPFLVKPEGIEILRAIGLFHVHGHKDECFAPNYVPGCGNVDGEILETLWSALNHISASTRRASAEHRREIIDDHMNDNNWKKLLRLGGRTIID